MVINGHPPVCADTFRALTGHNVHEAMVRLSTPAPCRTVRRAGCAGKSSYDLGGIFGWIIPASAAAEVVLIARKHADEIKSAWNAEEARGPGIVRVLDRAAEIVGKAAKSYPAALVFLGLVTAWGAHNNVCAYASRRKLLAVLRGEIPGVGSAVEVAFK